MNTGPKYTLSMFAEHVGEQFQLRDPSGESCTVELVDANGQASCQSTEKQPTDTGNFSIVFFDPAASDQSYRGQAIYRLEHPVMGQIDIFLVPIGPNADGNGMQYEAVFTTAG